MINYKPSKAFSFEDLPIEIRLCFEDILPIIKKWDLENIPCDTIISVFINLTLGAFIDNDYSKLEIMKIIGDSFDTMKDQ